MREHLQFLAQALRENSESDLAETIENAIAGPAHERDAFLVSNELWGGSGSLADQAGVTGSKEARRKIELALIQLGDEQIRIGKVNQRTAMWVSAFKKWEKDGI